MLEWLLSKRQEITSVGENVEKKESLCTVSETVNWYNHYRKHYRGSSKNLKIELSYDPAIPLPGIYLEGTKTLFHKDIYTPMITAA